METRITRRARDAFEAARIPISPVQDLAELVDHPQLRYGESIVDRQYGDAGTVLMPSVMPRMSRSPASISWAGRALGVDTEQVISEWLDGGTARQLSGEESTLSA